ncbi:Restriction endonuclease subunit S [Vibrio aestuarianus]|uniref:restriction endonuclease subunit S n=1 Tax=Vibrio aestuarianus TaxID=28171 RepID=UPI001455FE92|nr:restriction endonuclease subunit S [Vibrio aestuarianus]NLS56588.1 restriction endonuclease subunit S [Vibrio aestuarianus subsp. francensis]CAH8232362.1 Restriction endonuclease subunit S [Vibrio aestuarianus]
MTGRYKAYPEYKDSKLEWLGKVPEHWGVEYSKWLFQERNKKAKKTDEMLTASQKYGVIPQKMFMKLEQQKVVQVQKGHDILKKVIKSDFVISMRSFQGGIEFCDYNGAVSSAYVPLEPIKNELSSFFKYLFKSNPYIQALQATTNLVRDGQALRYNNFIQVKLPLPTENEAKAIGNFLDHETAKIDTLIMKQEKLIELLKEKRQAVISHAVTKGLNPDAPMKDSGVEWLGEVPEHWVVPRIKQIVDTPVTDGPHETPTFVDSGVPFVSAEAVSKGFVDFSKIRGFITEQQNAIYSTKYSPKIYDIYMVKSGATTGVTAIVETNEIFNIWSPLAVMRCKNDYYPYFALYFMRSHEFQKAVELNWSFGTQQNIGMGVIENLHIACPPKNEAIQIANYLQNIMSRFERLVDKANKQIALMKERKSALISAAVTGKIDVR